MRALNALSQILSRMAHHAAKGQEENLALKEEVEELKKQNEYLKMRLDREKGLVQTSRNNEAEIRSHCNELIQENKELEEQLDEQKRLHTELRSC